MLQFDIFTITSLLSSAVILIMGISLLAISVPKDPELHSYRVSRRFLAVAYIILAGVSQWEVWRGIESVGNTSVIVFTLIVASFQALFFMLSTFTLINAAYMTTRRIWSNIIPISLLGAILASLHFIDSGAFFYPIFYTMLGLYCLQLTCYMTLFYREYNRYLRRLDNYFSGDEYRRLKWIRSAFIMASCTGIAATISLLSSRQVYLVFTIAYTLFYIYFALKFINYVTLFHRIAPAVSESENETANGKAIAADCLKKALGEWIAQKRFIYPDLSLKSLSQELATNPAYLSRFINSEYGQNFRSWVNSLRVSEAQKLIVQQNDISLQEIGEKVGIPSSSTFYRQFVAVTGMTPAEYRRSAVST